MADPRGAEEAVPALPPDGRERRATVLPSIPSGDVVEKGEVAEATSSRPHSTTPTELPSTESLVEPTGTPSAARRAEADALSFVPISLDSIERSFVAVMKDLNREGEELAPFRRLYDGLHRALLKTSDSEKRLLAKKEHLEAERDANKAKIVTALQLSKQDEEEINSLRKEIEKAWKQVDQAQEVERSAREMIQVLRHDVAELAKQVESGSSQTKDQESNVRDLINSRHQLLSEHSVASTKVLQLKRQYAERQALVIQTTRHASDIEEQLKNNLEMYQQLLRGYETTQAEREELEKRLQEFQLSIDKISVALEQLRLTNGQATTEEKRMKDEVTSLRVLLVELGHRCEHLQRDVASETERLHAMENNVKRQKKKIPERESTLSAKQVEVVEAERRLDRAQQKIAAQKEAINQKLAERKALQEKTERHQRAVLDLADKLQQETHRLHQLDAEMKEAMQVKSQLKNDKVRAEHDRVAQEGAQFMERGKNHHLQRELDAQRALNEDMRKEIYTLEQAKDRHHRLNQRSIAEYQQTKEQIRQVTAQLERLRLQVGHNELRIASQNALYEQLRSDRTTHHKHLVEAEQELVQWRETFSSTAEKIAYYKDELAHEEQRLCEAHEAKLQVEREIVNATHRVSSLREEYAECKTRTSAQQREAESLNRIIAECDAEKNRQKSKISALLNERNVLATQLLRRNEELTILHAKVRLQHSLIQKAEEEHRRRVGELVNRAAALRERRVKFRLALVRLQQFEAVKQQLLHVEAKYWQERHKFRALSEELMNPRNVHRWCYAESTNPEHMDELLKVQLTQKQLAQRTRECVAKTELLSAKECEYERLQKKLARLPGPEAAEDLHQYSVSLSDRREQLRAMETQWRRLDLQVDEKQEDVAAMQLALVQTKQKLFLEKSRHTLLKRERELRSELQPAYATHGGARHSSSRSYPLYRSNATARSGGGTTSAAAPRQRSGTLADEHIAPHASTARTLGHAAAAAPVPPQRRFAGGGFAITR